MTNDEFIESARAIIKTGRPLSLAGERLLLVEVDRLRLQIERLKCVLGPVVPKCSGCAEEWATALRIVNGDDE